MEAIHHTLNKSMFLSFIYVDFIHVRVKIWNVLLRHNLTIKISWIVNGNFNMISSWNEKQGGNFHDDGSMVDFNNYITQSGLYDISLIGVGPTINKGSKGSTRN
uniref:Uncharacterized protein n=1 Tax=Kalanchoe fedtschenkoi TaxID=63787 RepID=A0A7N0ZXQ0_KALFE